MVSTVIKSNEDLRDLNIGVVYNHGPLVTSSDPANFSYTMEGHAVKSGVDLVDNVLALWQELEFVAVDMPVAPADLAGLRYLRKVNDTLTNRFCAFDGLLNEIQSVF